MSLNERIPGWLSPLIQKVKKESPEENKTSVLLPVLSLAARLGILIVSPEITLENELLQVQKSDIHQSIVGFIFIGLGSFVCQNSFCPPVYIPFGG